MKHNLRYSLYMIGLVCLAALLGYFDGESERRPEASVRAEITRRK